MLQLLNNMTNLKVFGFVNKCMKVLRLNSTPCIQKIRRLMSGRQVFQADSIQFSANQNRILPASGKADCIRYAKIFIESTDSRFRIPVFDKLGAFMLGMHTPVKHLRVVNNPQGEMLGGYIGLPLSKDEYFISSMAVAKPKHAPKVLAKIYKDMVAAVRKNNSRVVTCLVCPDVPGLVKLYRKLGFKVNGITDPEFNTERGRVLYHMSINADDFCKIL